MNLATCVENKKKTLEFEYWSRGPLSCWLVGLMQRAAETGACPGAVHVRHLQMK